MDKPNIDINEIVAELSPEGRLHFENAQLRVVVKHQAAELAELRAASDA